jgi:hypothetical protein
MRLPVFFIVAAHARQPRRFTHEMSRAGVIRMRIVPVRSEQHARAHFADDAHERAARFVRNEHMTVGLRQIEPRVESHDARRFARFFGAAFRRSARAHLAARHVEHARTIIQRFQLQQRSGHRQFRIIGVREDGQRVYTCVLCDHHL